MAYAVDCSCELSCSLPCDQVFESCDAAHSSVSLFVLYVGKERRFYDMARKTIVSPHPALSTQHSAPSTQHPALSTQHPALSTQHSAPSTQHPALSTQHSALSTQHSAPNPDFAIGTTTRLNSRDASDSRSLSLRSRQRREAFQDRIAAQWPCVFRSRLRAARSNVRAKT